MNSLPICIERGKAMIAAVVGRAVDDLGIMRSAGYIVGDATNRQRIWEDMVLYSAWTSRDRGLLASVRRLVGKFPVMPRRRVIELVAIGRASKFNPVGHTHFRGFEDADTLVPWFRGAPLSIACDILGVSRETILRKVNL